VRVRHVVYIINKDTDKQNLSIVFHIIIRMEKTDMKKLENVDLDLNQLTWLMQECSSAKNECDGENCPMKEMCPLMAKQ